VTADPLETPRPAFTLADAARIAASAFGISGDPAPLHSERDLNFRVAGPAGRVFLLKLHNPADDVNVIDMQTRALRHIGRVDPALPVTRVVPTLDGEAWQPVTGRDGRTSFARLFTFLPGHNPAARDLDDRALFEWGRVVARLGRALRGFYHPAAGYEIQWDIRRAASLRPRLTDIVDDARRALVTRVLDRFDANVGPVIDRLRAQVIHNDMSLGNVLVDDGCAITGITDFGDMTHTSLVCDLAVAIADVLDGREDALAMAVPMIAGYTSVTSLERQEAALLGDLVATRCATAVAITAWRRQGEQSEQGQPGELSSAADGAWRFLRLLDAEGLDRVGFLFSDAAGRGRGQGAGVCYRPVPTADLLRARRAVLGPATLSYDPPVHLVRGEGVWLFDPEGRRYLDAYNNVPVAGHGHPAVTDAIATQVHLLNTNTRYLHEAIVELAERLLATMPGHFDRVLLVNSGSEANDIAWRIARFVTGGRGAVVTRCAYHGVTHATTDLSPEEWPAGFAPEHVALAPAPDGYRGEHRRDEPGWEERYGADVATAAAELDTRGMRLAAMFVDSAFISDGILGPVPRYIRAAARAVHGAGGLFVADEVQAGFGRTGEHLWSFAPAGAGPDIVTLGKPMGNGFPVAAVVTRSDLADDFAERTGYFSTFGGNPVACAAGLAVLRVVQEGGLTANAAQVGAHLRGRLESLAERHRLVGDVRGWGLLAGIELVRDLQAREPAADAAKRAAGRLRERGILIGVTGPAGNVLKIRPPLVFERQHADLLAETLDEVLTELET